MRRDQRIATTTLVASIGLHISVLTIVSLLWRETPHPVHRVTTRYVVHMQQPISAPSPSVIPPAPEPIQPVSPQQVTDTIEPLRPHAIQPLQPRQRAKLPEEVSVRPADPQDLSLPKPRQPRKPSEPQHPLSTSRPLPSEVAATPPAVKPPAPQAPDQPQPKQPHSQPQQATSAPPPQNGAEAQDVIQAYLAQVFAALERHKYYPAIARRRRLHGRVVVQFVILPDGRILNPQITEQNGAAPFSQAALNALRRASPLPAFPPKLEQPRLLVEVPIVYHLEGER